MLRAMDARAISLTGHLEAAYSKNSPLKPELMAFWAHASCFSCPTSFRMDRFCADQGKICDWLWEPGWA